MDRAILLAAVGGVTTWALWQGRRPGRALTDAPRQNALLLCLGLAASFLGGGFSFGLAGQAHGEGIGAVVGLWGFSAGTVAVGLAGAPGLTRLRGGRSVGSVVGAAWGPGARAATGLLACAFCAAVLGAQLKALGLALAVWLGVDWRLGVAVGLLAVAALAAGGGAAALTRLAPAQTALLLTGVGLALALGLVRAGGLAGLAVRLPVGYLDPLDYRSGGELLGLFLLFATGETLSPPAVQRLLEARDAGAARRGALLAGGLSAVMFVAAGGLGLIARALFPAGEGALALPQAMAVLPVGLRGLAAAGVVGGLLAAGSAYLAAAVANLQADVPGFPAGIGAGRVLTAAVALAAAAVAALAPGVLAALTFAYRLWAPAVVVPVLAAAHGDTRPGWQFWAVAGAGLLCAGASQAFTNPVVLPSPVFGIIGSGLLYLLLPKGERRCVEERPY